MRHFARHGGTPVAFHQRWLAETRLDYSAVGVSEHQALVKIVEVAMMHDQLDLGQLASFELVSRRLQALHDRWKHKLPQPAAGQVASDLDDSHLLLGTSETRANVAICPALTAWIGSELAKEALAQKERRKAREERALALKNGK